MKSLIEISNQAERIARKAAVRADSMLNGDIRARRVFNTMPAMARQAMQEQVKNDYGEQAWRDFQTMLGE